MKQYRFVGMKRKMLGEYVTEDETERSHRNVVVEMAGQGWRFINYIPVDMDGYGKLKRYDLVFEKDTDE
ncbi:MAG: DUF4177 domain-containing protein [Ruminococcus sp.]|nr:DUF4177 domain-containing protein [Ruminococcus sp.]